MAENGPDPGLSNPQPGGLLARLRGMMQGKKPTDPMSNSPEELLPDCEQAGPDQNPIESQDGQAISPPVPIAALAEVTDLAFAEMPSCEPVMTPSPEAPAASPVTDSATIEVKQPGEPQAKPQAISAAPAEAALKACPFCNAIRVGTQAYCDNCGLVFPLESAAIVVSEAPNNSSSGLLKGRYERVRLLSQRGDVERYSGLDHGSGSSEALPVTILSAPSALDSDSGLVIEAIPVSDGATTDEYLMPSFDEPDDEPVVGRAAKFCWPSIVWEKDILEKVQHPALPVLLDHFVEDAREYLVEELPVGQVLWDAWDDPGGTNRQRFRWLAQVAESMHRLHQAGAIFEAIRPEMVCIAPTGQARLTDLSELLPLPLPPHPQLRATLYTAPELVLAGDQADARADLYTFGAMIFALHAGRELTESDFERQGVPKPFIPTFPDIHPAFGRLISKTFCRQVENRFPSDEASREDPTGFTELIRTLEVCGRMLDQVRMEIAAWTTTGMIRTGNEDAFALLHAIESRQDDLSESTLVLLADGMGGYEAGEVAAALAIQSLRKLLLREGMFALLAGDTSAAQVPFDLDKCKEIIRNALKAANHQVFSAARSGIGRRGMGCTAEVVYVNGRHVVVGHVGDSRIYHLHHGRLIQVTRDQTLVNRLLELGTLTPEEAETHPRRSELQQAIGGHADVDPAIYDGIMSPNDWIIVCSDGLSNHITALEMQQMLQSEATSAEMAARRLVNFTNIKGATDNATVVVVRAT